MRWCGAIPVAPWWKTFAFRLLGRRAVVVTSDFRLVVYSIGAQVLVYSAERIR